MMSTTTSFFILIILSEENLNTIPAYVVTTMNPTSYRGDFGILDPWLTDKTLAYGGSNRCYPHEVGLRRLIHTRVGAAFSHQP
jgi:hypothetical protein